jgi:hypothetical protein
MKKYYPKRIRINLSSQARLLFLNTIEQQKTATLFEKT